jgi:hypothetical protein
MPHPGAALSNLLFLLDLPVTPAVGQAGLTGSPLAEALARVAGEVTDLEGPGAVTASADHDLVVSVGRFAHGAGRAVRPGGWLVVLRDRSDGVRPSGPRFPATEIRRWLVSPGLEEPRALVPDTRAAMRAYERTTRERGWKRVIRLTAISAGWRVREFSGEVVAMRVR